jgi:alkylation response protein AidB-like acyl-CoA dehydrogenase
VALFQNLTPAEERDLVESARLWQAQKSDAGFAGLTWPAAYGGRGLSAAHAAAYAQEESHFLTPDKHEILTVTLDLVAPTLLRHGTADQKLRHIPRMLRADELWCQLFSEPGAGSDLASLQTTAVRDGQQWTISGQKVWTSGAQHAHFGYLLARTDRSESRHAGITAFVVPLDGPGVEIRPLRQMTGGVSFSQVFLDSVRVSDEARIGDIGDGWKVAMTTLGFERAASSGGGGGAVSGYVLRLLDVARARGVHEDPVKRQGLADVWIRSRLVRLTAQRARDARRAGKTPGPEGSIGKLLWTDSLQRAASVAAELLGPSLTADSGEWGTYAWSEFVLGMPGYRIGGGTDEVQKNIIAERALGLPKEPQLPAAEGTR